jgi:general L-amino acid transport system permease protein
LGIIQSGLTSGKWIATNTPPTGYLFAAMIFFMFCFAMSRYSVGLEKRLNTGHAQ